jgi:hypothetical protein
MSARTAVATISLKEFTVLSFSKMAAMSWCLVGLALLGTGAAPAPVSPKRASMPSLAVMARPTLPVLQLECLEFSPPVACEGMADDDSDETSSGSRRLEETVRHGVEAIKAAGALRAWRQQFVTTTAFIPPPLIYVFCTLLR